MSDPQKKTIGEIFNAVYSGSTLAGEASTEEILNAVYDETADALRISGMESVTPHAASHVDGTDDIRDATNALKGLATAAQVAAIEWQLGSHKYDAAVSGAVTIDPTLGSRIAANVDGNITGVTIALSATYPWVVVELTTDGAYTLDLTGWELDGGEAISLPDIGTCIIVFSLGADNTTKYAFLAGTDIA